MRGGFTPSGGTSRPLLTTEETDIFGRSVRKIKHHITHFSDFLSEFPFDPHSQEGPIECCIPAPPNPWGHCSFAKAISGTGKPPIYTVSDDEEELESFCVEDYYVTPALERQTFADDVLNIPVDVDEYPAL